MKKTMHTLEWNGRIAERFKTGDCLIFKETSEGVKLQAIRKDVIIYFLKETEGILEREEHILLGDITFDVVCSFAEVLASNVGGVLEYRRNGKSHCFEFIRRPKGKAIK